MDKTANGDFILHFPLQYGSKLSNESAKQIFNFFPNTPLRDHCEKYTFKALCSTNSSHIVAQFQLFLLQFTASAQIMLKVF